MERGDSTTWLRSGAPALVVRLLRVVGLAPLVYEPRGVRVSRALSFYGKVLITVFSVVAVLSKIIDLGTTQFTRKSNTTTVIWKLESISVLSIVLVGAYFSSSWMETWIEHLKRIHMIETQLGCGNVSNANKRKELVFVLVTIIILIVLLGANLVNIYISIILVIDKIIEMQLILIYRHLTSLLLSFNKNLEDLLRSTDDHHDAEFAFQDKLITSPDNAGPRRVFVSPRSINRVIDMLGTSSFTNPQSSNMVGYAPYPRPIQNEIRSQKGNAKVATKVATSLPLMTARSGPYVARKQQMKLVRLNTIYPEICELVDNMNNGIDGTMAFLIILNGAVHLILTSYKFVNLLRAQPLSIELVLLEMLWLLFHFIDINMIIDPGHRMIQADEQTRFSFAKLVEKAHVFNDEARGELQKLFITLKLNKPMFAPRGVCTLSRRLLLSVIGAAVTYLVILEQFRLAES